jgi:CRISPR/Cas system-associated endoribonuclease Cas2
MKGYGTPWQFSIFMCFLTRTQRITLQREVEGILNMEADYTAPL